RTPSSLRIHLLIRPCTPSAFGPLRLRYRESDASGERRISCDRFELLLPRPAKCRGVRVARASSRFQSIAWEVDTLAPSLSGPSSGPHPVAAPCLAVAPLRSRKVVGAV